MNCPRCGAPLEENKRVCDECGAEVPAFDADLVFSERGFPTKHKSPARKIIIIAICVLLAVGTVAALFWAMNVKNGGEGDSAPATASQAQTKPTSAPVSATEAKPPETTSAQQPSGEGSADAQAKLEKYLENSDFYEALLSYADGNMSVDRPTVERSLVIVRYVVNGDSKSEEDAEYFNTLDGYFSNVCSNLGGEAYDMKNGSGVKNARIEVTCVDQNGVAVFSGVVD